MMFIRNSLRSMVLAAGLVGGLAGTALADDPAPTPAHIAAARAAVEAAKTSKGFDNLLPLLDQQTQNRLIRMRPDQHQAIAKVVDAQALALVPRRNDLDNDVAVIWAKYFTEDELKAITAFYQSPAGTKLAEIGPKVIGETLQAVKGWSDETGQEMLDKSTAALKKQGVDF